MNNHEEEYEKARGRVNCKMLSKVEREEMVLSTFRIIGYDEEIPGLIAQNKFETADKLILFLHGLGGKKEDSLAFRTFLRDFEFSIMAIDARGHGERKKDFMSLQPETMVSYWNKTIVDNRLAIDIAFRNGWVKEGKLILAGVSMGGILGGVVAGVDKRVSGTILYVPGGDLAEVISNSTIGRSIPLSTLALPFIRTMLASVDPINYVDKISPRPLLIQLGKYDNVVPFKNGMKLFEKAKEPKQLIVHDSGHAIPVDKAIEETINWMKKNFP
ncbi:MAG: alpha/beta hydrolase, partial [Thermoproteota archaeon]